MTAELRSLDFHGEVVFLVSHPESGKPFVPAKPICAQLGIDWRGQHAKLTADPDLWGYGDISIPSPGGPQTMTCLPLENLQGWLFGIQASRVKPEFREKLRAYQKECFQALDAYWRTGAAIRPEVRAAAPQATQALFREIEDITGLNPESAQPDGLKDWQVRCLEARLAVLNYLDDLAAQEGMNQEKAMICFRADAELRRLPPEIQALLPLANARMGPSERRTLSRRTLQRWRADARQSPTHLAPADMDRPEPEWLPMLREIVAHPSRPNMAQAWRMLPDHLPEGMIPPSYDAVLRWSKKTIDPTPARTARRATGVLTAELVKELRELFGDEGAKASLQRMFPELQPEAGGAQ